MGFGSPSAAGPNLRRDFEGPPPPASLGGVLAKWWGSWEGSHLGSCAQSPLVLWGVKTPALYFVSMRPVSSSFLRLLPLNILNFKKQTKRSGSQAVIALPVGKNRLKLKIAHVHPSCSSGCRLAHRRKNKKKSSGEQCVYAAPSKDPVPSTAEGGFWITTEALPHVTFSRKSSVLRDERSYI